MPRIIMVRHGQAAAGFGDDLDPGLSDLGREQAIAAANALASIGPQPIIASPLRRCRETARALADLWSVPITIDAAVGEIISPADHAGLDARSAWLGRAMQGTWAALEPELHTWRQSVVDRVLAITEDTVVHSHFIAINAVVGAATNDDRVVCFRPDNCSWTTFDVDARGGGGPHGHGNIAVVEMGRQADTDVR